MKPGRHGRKILVEMLGISISLTGVVVLIGHAIGVNSITSWNTDVQMSVPTAITFVCTGIAFFLLGDMEQN